MGLGRILDDAVDSELENSGGLEISEKPFAADSITPVIIGILGFTPFGTAFVFFRNGFRAILNRGGLSAHPWQPVPLLLGCVVACAGPVLFTLGINQVVSDSVEEIIHGDARQASIAARRVRPLRFLSGAKFERIVDEYMKDSDSPRKERLKQSYKEATGEDIDTKIAILMD